MSSESNFTKKREEMVTKQLIARGINDKSVLDAFRKVPREMFIPQADKEDSYGDHPVSIGLGQTISQPYMVAVMTELLDLKKRDKVLEIGTGSGYQTAILAELAAWVYTLERIESLSQKAGNILAELGYTNITRGVGDGSCGWQEHGPYDAIIVTCSAPCVPEPLKEQLAEGGRLVIPVGTDLSQVLTVVEKRQAGFKERQICGCVFVPLIGKHGWGDL